MRNKSLVQKIMILVSEYFGHKGIPFVEKFVVGVIGFVAMYFLCMPDFVPVFDELISMVVLPILMFIVKVRTNCIEGTYIDR